MGSSSESSPSLCVAWVKVDSLQDDGVNIVMVQGGTVDLTFSQSQAASVFLLNRGQRIVVARED